MTAKSKMALAAAVPIILSFGSILGSSARADSLDFEQTPMSNVIAKLDNTFGISIVVVGSHNPGTPVDLMVADTSNPNARLDAVNQLANSLKSDYQKSFVVSHIPDASIVPDVHLDTLGGVVFQDNTVDAVSAIKKIGLLDGAVVQFADPVTGNVNLSDDRLSAQEAANQIAQQTHTHWLAVYTIEPRSLTASVQGTVVGRTNEGQAILQLPFATYVVPTSKTDTSVATAATTTQGTTAAPMVAPGTLPAYPQGTYPAGQYAPYAGTVAQGPSPQQVQTGGQAAVYPNPYTSTNPYANPYGYVNSSNPYASSYTNPYGSGYGNDSSDPSYGYSQDYDPNYALELAQQTAAQAPNAYGAGIVFSPNVNPYTNPGGITVIGNLP